TCTSAVAGSGTATGGSFSIAVSVTDNTTTNYFATSTDAAGNTSACSTSTVQYVEDSLSATVTVIDNPSQSDPTNVSPIKFQVTFSENVTGFDASDLLFGGTAGGTKVATITG